MLKTPIRHSLRAAGAALVLTAAAFTMLAPAAPAHATIPDLPSAIATSPLPGAPPSANPLQGYQGLIHAVPPGHALLPNLYQATKFFRYWDYFRGWGFMRVDYVKFNWHTDSKLIKVTLYHKVYTHFGYYWVASCGSGSEYNGLYTFGLDRQGDGLGHLYFEGRAHEWNTYHPVGDPAHPRWWYIVPITIL